MFELENCPLNVGYFNLIFYSAYMMHALVSWIVFPFAAVHLYIKTGRDCQRINEKISQIRNLPSTVFDHQRFKAQDFCAICMEDFTTETMYKKGSQITWLSCDKRHYFHTDCIRFWLHRQSVCHLCKASVDFSKINRHVKLKHN